ncbi:MAG: MBL fold metallo-hydrolase [Eubacterium sp.]|nr:MBL fold metallo-hydrolase [Candidatus Colimonas fimequi]
MKITSFACSPYQTNSYLVIDEESKKGFIVDPGGYVPPLTEMVRSEQAEIEYIIITHGHSDHRAGLDEYKADFPDAKVVVFTGEAQDVPGRTEFGNTVVTVPDTLVNDEDELPFAGMTLQFKHTPGHTTGGMCVFIPEAHVLFSGDTLFRQSIGRTDFPGGSYREIDKSIKTKLYVLPDDTQVFPGHMGPTTIGFEKENNPFVFG